MSPLHTPAAGRGRVAQTVSACVHKRRWRLRIPNKRRNQGTGDFARAFRTSVSSPHPSCCVVQTKSQHASTKRDGGWWIPAEPRNLSTGDFAPAFRTCVGFLPRNGSVSRERADRLTDFFSANGSQGLCAWKTPGHHGAEGRS